MRGKGLAVCLLGALFWLVFRRAMSPVGALLALGACGAVATLAFYARGQAVSSAHAGHQGRKQARWALIARALAQSAGQALFVTAAIAFAGSALIAFNQGSDLEHRLAAAAMAALSAFYGWQSIKKG